MVRPSALQTIEAMFGAFAARDVDAIAECVTEDAIIRPSAFVGGVREYRGRRGLRDGLAEVGAALREREELVRIRPKRFFADRERSDLALVLASIKITRMTGETFGSEVAYLFKLWGEKIAAIDAWLDHVEGLRRLAEPVEIQPPGPGAPPGARVSAVA